jgi:hypothetical protein
MSALVDLTAGAVANTATKRGGVLPQKGTTAENDAYTGAVGEITYESPPLASLLRLAAPWSPWPPT